MYEDPIKTLQVGLSEGDPRGLHSLSTALDLVIDRKLWGEFQTFGHFAIAPLPGGLGLQSTPAAKILRLLLIRGKRYVEWASTLAIIVRPVGKPKKLVKEEGFRPFYSLPRATTALDRMLFVLQRDHSEYLAEISAGAMTPREAAIKSGLVRIDDNFRSIHWTYGHASVSQLFLRLPIEGQCRFIADTLDPVLEEDLAARWRKKAAVSE